MKGADGRQDGRDFFLSFCLTLRKVRCPAMDFLERTKTDHRKTWRNSQQRDLSGVHRIGLQSSAQMDLGQLGQEKKLNGNASHPL